MYVYYNCNPAGAKVGDCVIRAISTALNQSWEKTYTELCVEGLQMYDMPNANAVWSSYLRSKGYKRYVIPNTCPDCYTIGQFAEDNPQGTYILATGTHAVCVKDSCVLDSWDSSSEIPTYYFAKE